MKPSRSNIDAKAPRSVEELLGVFIASAVVVAWLFLLAPMIVGRRPLTEPFAALSAVVFVLLGAFSATLLLNRRTRELARQAAVLEERVLAREEEALRGRALAAMLQGQAVRMEEEAHGAILDHAHLSRALFGDLIGDEVERSGRSASDLR